MIDQYNAYKDLRGKLGLTMYAISLKLDMHPHQWAAYEKGKKIPRIPTLVKIVEYARSKQLDFMIDDFINYDKIKLE